MKVKVLLLVFLTATLKLVAQNMVVNPGFEINAGCPGTVAVTDELSLATGWHSARIEANYFNACANGTAPGSGVPANDAGFQLAATGNAYAGVKAYEKGTLSRGYIYGTLSSPMVADRVYEVSFKVSLAESSSLAVSNLGVRFAVSTNECIFNPACPYPYPIENIAGVTMDTIRNNMDDWVKISMFVFPDQAYEYIILGVFDDVPLESVQSAAASEAYYYIDDVAVAWREDIIADGIPGCLVNMAQYDETCFGADDGSISAEVWLVDGPYSIHWSPAPSGGQGTDHITGLEAGTYTVTVTTAYSTCSASTTILQPDPMELEIDLLNPSCNEANGYIHVFTADTNQTYTYGWNTNPSQTSDSIGSLLPGNYTVTATNGDGCTISKTFNLVNTGLNISVDPSNPEIMPGDSVQLTAYGGIEYQWSPVDHLSCSDCDAPYASPEYTTDYVVTGTNAAGCIGTKVVRVSVWCSDIFIPTIFSPNGDGQNDYLCKLGGCVSSMTFIIYNRWGEKVFETTDPEVCWDGSFKGSPAEAGAYVYQLQGRDREGKEILQAGSITLVR